MGFWAGRGMANGAGILGTLFFLIVFIDLILLGIWLFKQIGKD